MKQLENPFPVTTYYGAEYFCDRQEETLQLISNIQNGLSTTLVALRRIGKTGLIHHALSQLPQGWRGIYIDILDTENLNHFLNKMATAILNAEPEKSSKGKLFWEFVKSLRPSISFDVLTGSPTASFDIKQKDVELNISTALNFLENQDFKTVVAIDEFQQILYYPEKNTDAWLRSRVQELKNIVFIFSGSQQHVMNRTFSSPQRPFFRSTQLLKLEKIKQEIYRDFIVSLFHTHHKEISPIIATDILEWSNTHTFYVQQICNRVFASTKKMTTDEIWKEQAYKILKEQEIVFLSYRNMLTKPQWQLLKAIAHKGKVYHPTAKAFIEDHHLGTSATILRSLKSLSDYELIYSDFDPNGEKFYSVYDVLFEKWMENKLEV